MRAFAFAMFFLLGFLVAFMPVSADIVINEINPWGSINEWLELYNTGDEPVSIGGWIIETAKSPKDAVLPETSIIPAKGFFVIGDNGTRADYEETITITDTLIFVALWNKQNQTQDSVNLSGFDGNGSWSIQRKNPNPGLSNDTTNWLVANPTKGTENFPPVSTIEIIELSLPQEIFANETFNINITVSSSGESGDEELLLEVNSTSCRNESWIFDKSNEGIRIQSIDWAEFSVGNFTLCASIGNSSLCREFSAYQKPEKFAVLEITLGSNLTTHMEYSSLFKIVIENKSQIEGSCDKKDNVTVSYNITSFSGNYNLSDNFTAEVGCTKDSGTGKWVPLEAGNYTLCGGIVNSTSRFNDSLVCKTIFVRSMEEIPCNLTVLIESRNILGYEESELFNITIKDNFSECKDCPVEITYSIENSSGTFLSGYPKMTNKTIGNKNSFSFTPKLDCGTAVYKIRANISKAFCNDSSIEDNAAETLINITGKTIVCPVTPVKETKKTSTDSGTSGSGGSTSPATTKSKLDPVLVEIAYLENKVASGKEFFSRLSVRNNGNTSQSVDIYSYAYDGKRCITGGWTINLMQVSLAKGETKEVSLKNKVEEGTKPGEYIFRARVKLDGKNFDTDGDITVIGEDLADEKIELIGEVSENQEALAQANISQPQLRIWNDTKLRINLTNCEGCMMEIAGPGANITTDKKYRVFDQKGIYTVIVARNGTVLLNQTYEFTNSSRKDLSKTEMLEEDGIEDFDEEESITGDFAKAGKPEGFFTRILSFLKGLFSPILSLMSSSIAK